MESIRPSICILRKGEEIYNQISDLIVYHYDYDESIELLRKAYRYSRYWPVSLFTRVELTVTDIIIPLAALAIGFVCELYGKRDLSYAIESINWPGTQGVIIESRVWEHSDEDFSPEYDPEIKYSYKVNGRVYINDAVNYDRVNRGEEWAKNVISDYPQGHIVTVYYKPDNPEFSVLERGVSASTIFPVYFGYVSMIFSIVYFLARSLWSLRRGVSY